MPSGCALLGGFATGALVSLLLHHITEREMSASACTLHSLYAWLVLVLVLVFGVLVRVDAV